VGRPAAGSEPVSGAETAAGPAQAAASAATAPRVPTLADSAAVRIGDRAFQDREIVYFLQPPETHRFDLFHDYTNRAKAWTSTSTWSVPAAPSRILPPSRSIGERLAVETLKGDAITKAGVDVGERVTPDTEVVVIRYPAVKKGQSVRLRISETYTDAARYGLVGRRSCGGAPSGGLATRLSCRRAGW